MPGGRPLKYTPKYRKDLLKKFEHYINNTECPIIVEFAVKNNIAKQRIYEFQEFADLLKKANNKFEQYLVNDLLHNKASNKDSSRMFLLKCIHGYVENAPINIDIQDNKSYVQINIKGKDTEELESLADEQIRKLKEGNIRKQTNKRQR